MLKLSHRSLIILSGLIWFAVGCGLLQLGLNLLIDHAQNFSDGRQSGLLSSLVPFFGGREEAAAAVIACALFIGYFKGRYVLGKSARKGIERILQLPNPAPLHWIYNARYYLLLALMIGLGLSIKFFGLPGDIRGGIDVAIGAALINGAIIYFQYAFQLKRTLT